MSTKKRYFGIVLILLALGLTQTLFNGCRNKSAKNTDTGNANGTKQDQQSGNSAIQIKYVSVTELKPQEFNHYLEVQGKFDGDENVAVSPKSMGVITQIYVKNGEQVKKNQQLAQLDDEVLQKSMKELKSSYDLANQLYEKQKNLWDQKIGTEVQYLTAKTNKESLENRIATLNDQIDMMKIKSPIDGTVEDVPVKLGQSLAPGITAFRVINFSHIKVVAEVAEAYTAKVKTGDEVIVYVPDMNKEIKARISFASKYINPTNRTFIVEVRLEPREIDARANMIAVIKINDYKVPSTIVVSVNLVQKSLDKQFVYLVKEENNKMVARKQTITQGMTYNGLTEIKSGLKEGDKAITVGYNDLNDGQPVSVSN